MWITRSSGFGHLPDLLHPQLPALRLKALELEVVDRGAGQVPLGPLGQHGGLGDHVGAGLEVARAPRRRGRVPCRPSARPGRSGRRPGAGRRRSRSAGRRPPPRPSRPGTAPASRSRSRSCRGCGSSAGSASRAPRASGQQVDRVLGHLPVDRPVGGIEIGEQLPHRRRAHVRAGERGAPRRPCPSRSPPPAPRRASPSAPARPRAARISLIAQARPAGPPPTIATPTSIRSSSGSVGSVTNSLRRVDRRREFWRARLRAISRPSSPSPPRSASAGSCAGRRPPRGRRTRRSARSGPC